MSTTDTRQSLYNHLQAQLDGVLPIVRLTKATLIHLSHTLEDIVLTRQLPALVFTGFQESSHWKQEAERYEQISNVAQQICIFAGRPLPEESNASQLHIELADGDPLRQEWFLAILTRRFSVLLCGLDCGLHATHEANRQFDTIWTFDPSLIDQALDVLEVAINSYRPDRLATLQKARREFPMVNPDGEILTEFTANLIHFEENLNRELRWQRDLINTILKSISHQVYIFEIEGAVAHFVYMSPNFRALVRRRYPEHTELKPFFEEIIHPDDLEDVMQMYHNPPEGIAVTVEYRYQRGDGQYIWVEDTVTRFTDFESGVSTHYGVLRDITRERELREAEQRRQQLQIELETERELNAMKTYFMTRVTHEFRTPLATILSSSELVERYSEKMSLDERNNRLKQIQHQVMHLSEMLDDISIIINGDIAQLGFHPEVMTVRDAFEPIITHFTRRSGVNHVVDVNYADDLGQAPLDRHLLKHILDNLLKNAAKYSREGTTITVDLQRQEDQIIFSVQDEGVGIPVEAQDKIFETFYRADNVQSSAGGGLGLRIVADCVQLHQGTISYTSQVNEGSRFVVTLPV
jgi:signal transduction histidine kinase/DICT domain-containing protein